MIFSCLDCSKEYQARPSAKRQYCSYECYWKALKTNKYEKPSFQVTLICKFCGKEYKVVQSRKNNSKFCSNSCSVKFTKPKRKSYTTGKDHPMWKGGQTINTQGYILIRNVDHPNADTNGYVREHRLVLERHLDRYLEIDEVVHHVNGNKQDNRLENLEIMSRFEHLKLHPEITDKAHKAQIGRPPAPHKPGCVCFRCAKVTRSLST